MKNYNNYSGGAKGSDIAWEIIGKKYNVNTTAFSFNNHMCLSRNRKTLNDDELNEGWEMVLVCSKKMKRYVKKLGPYIKNLLSRNWFQVKYSDSIFAIGKIIYPGEKGNKYKNDTNIPIVDGGTGYAVMMAIESNKPVYVFDQEKNKWFKWIDNNFTEIEEPTLTENFTGIGTRELNENGVNAIKSIYKKTFE